MRKVHDVLRLAFDLKLSQRQIARSIKLSQSTVSEHLTRFQDAGLAWPLPDGYDDQGLQEKLFGATPSAAPAPAGRPPPDFAHIRHELSIATLPCNCFGRSTATPIPSATTRTPASGGITRSGAAART